MHSTAEATPGKLLSVMAYFDVAASREVVPGRPAVAYVGGVDVVVFRIGAELHAVERWCPHARGDLSEGTLAGGQLTCADHGWRFDVATGQCLVVKSAARPIARYRCRERDGRVEVEIPEGGEAG